MKIKSDFLVFIVFFITTTSYSQRYLDSNSIKGIWRTNDNKTLICIDSFLYLENYCYNYYFNQDTLFLLENYKQFTKNDYYQKYKTEFIDSFNFKIKLLNNRNDKYDRLESCRNVKSFIDSTIKFQGLFFSFSPRMSDHPPFKIEIDSIGNYFLWTNTKLNWWKYNKYSSFSSGKLDSQSLKEIKTHFKTTLIDSIPIDGGLGIDASYYDIDFKFNIKTKHFYGSNFPDYKYDFIVSIFNLYKIILKDSLALKTDNSIKIKENKFQLEGSLKSKKGYPKLDIKIIDSTNLFINEISKMYSTELNPDFYKYNIIEDTLYLFKPPLIQEKSFLTNNDSVVICLKGLNENKESQSFWRLNLFQKTIYKANLNGLLSIKLLKSSKEIKFKISSLGYHTEIISITPNSNKEIALTFLKRRLPYKDEFIFKKRNREKGFYIKRGYPLILEK